MRGGGQQGCLPASRIAHHIVNERIFTDGLDHIAIRMFVTTFCRRRHAPCLPSARCHDAEGVVRGPRWERIAGCLARSRRRGRGGGNV